MNLNPIDVLLAAVLLLGAWTGWRRGFLVGATGVLLTAASLAAAYFGHGRLVAWAQNQGVSPHPWHAPAAFLAIALVVRLVLGAAASAGLQRLPPKLHQHPVNRTLGLVPGLVYGAVNAAVLALLLLVWPADAPWTRAAQSSPMAEALAEPAEWVETTVGPVFEPLFESVAARSLQKLRVTPGEHESIRLPFTVANPQPRPDLEAAMLELVNQERLRRGLRPLKADPETVPVSRAHAADMFARGYFAHVSPDGRDPFDRLRAAHLRFVTAGENLALARTLKLAHQGLMNSPGHRANILRPSFGRVGIGIVDGGRHGLMVSQTFRN